jgi:hypothetical protein
MQPHGPGVGPFDMSQRIGGAAAVEKFFSVAAELAGGETRVLPVRGRSAGEAFQQAKTNPGVRRVGKVTEITPGHYEALQRGEIPPEVAAVTHRAHGSNGRHTSPEQPDAALARAQLNVPLTGPRVVLQARPTGGEQPFRHLQAPPERLGPPPKPEPQAAPKPKPQPTATPRSPQPPGAAPAASPPPMTQVALTADHSTEPTAGAIGAATATDVADPSREYRIVKSRRQGGDPYLLQRGQWHDRGGKRTFTVDWEKGFPTRPDAEHHQEWLSHREQELADLRRQAS